MRRLILLRHGQAERAAESEIDFERGLTARGRDDARRMGLWLAGQVGRIDLALVSPAARARQTWEEAGAAFVGTPVEHPTAFYAAEPAEMLRTAEASEAETVAVVAHNPGLHVLALQLTEATSAPASVRSAIRREFPPAAVAVFERGVGGCADRRRLPGAGRPLHEGGRSMSRVYKILSRTEWEAALKTGVLAGSPLDVKDGFIHLSTAEQAPQTARLHFHGRADLILLECETVALGANLKWEPSRGGQLFPHYYGGLPVSAVIDTHPLPLDPDGAPTPGPLRA